MAKVTKEYLKRIGALQERKPTPVGEQPAEDLGSAQMLNALVEKMSALNATQLDKLAVVLQTLVQNRPEPHTTVVEVPTPKPCTLKVKRDARGFIDSIDVVPK